MSFNGSSVRTVKNRIFYKDNRSDEQAFKECRITEASFPDAGKCYISSESLAGLICRPSCRMCSVWASLPDSESLAVSYIFECTCHGYDKRVLHK